MYIVEITQKCEQDLRMKVKAGSISQDELSVIRGWIQELEVLGPEYIESCGYWNDHGLTRIRAGERSSSFSSSGRIIYRIEKKKVVIKILKITPTHDY
jgi:hypothetical protein